jgi:hypothetical protein
MHEYTTEELLELMSRKSALWRLTRTRPTILTTDLMNEVREKERLLPGGKWSFSDGSVKHLRPGATRRQGIADLDEDS